MAEKPKYVSHESLISGGASKARPAGLINPNIMSGIGNAFKGVNVRARGLETPQVKPHIDRYPSLVSKEAANHFMKSVEWSANKIADAIARNEATEQLSLFKKDLHNLQYGMDENGRLTGIMHKTGGDFVKAADGVRQSTENLMSQYAGNLGGRAQQYFLGGANAQKDAAQNAISAKTVRENETYKQQMTQINYDDAMGQTLNTPGDVIATAGLMQNGLKEIAGLYGSQEQKILMVNKAMNQMVVDKVNQWTSMPNADGFNGHDMSMELVDLFDSGVFTTDENGNPGVNPLSVATMAKVNSLMERKLETDAEKEQTEMKAVEIHARKQAYNFIGMQAKGENPVTRENLPDHLTALQSYLSPQEFMVTKGVLVDYTTGDEVATEAGRKELNMVVNTSDTDEDFARKVMAIEGVTYNQRLQAWGQYHAGRANGVNNLVKQFESYMDSIARRVPRSSKDDLWGPGGDDMGDNTQDALYAVEGYKEQRANASSRVRAHLTEAIKNGTSLNEAFHAASTQQLDMTAWSAIKATEAVASQIDPRYSFISDIYSRTGVNSLEQITNALASKSDVMSFNAEFTTFMRESINSMRKADVPESIINMNIMTLDIQYELINDMAFKTGRYREVSLNSGQPAGDDRSLVEQARDK